ncbi:MAG: flagellar hook-basal body complex protein FliE [Betaproteobacteria bacterium]|nr:flagellar hook-basal body complex protein FliE [Betaproteobacteria bacterium]
MELGGIDRMLTELRSTAQVAAGKPAAAPQAAGGTDFGQALKSAIDQVNQAQQIAQQMAQDFSGGDTTTNLQDVMINLQKANLSFQQMVQVRNRVVSAYHEIMNMQV